VLPLKPTEMVVLEEPPARLLMLVPPTDAWPVVAREPHPTRPAPPQGR